MDTICAIATALQSAAIGVIRMSGDNAVNIADKIFKPYNKTPLNKYKAASVAVGKIYDEDELIDEVVVTVFVSPHSYTGENTVEISCHGSIYILSKIMQTLIKNGARQAECGEFTKRAFLNGKKDLTSAQAVADIISSVSKFENQIAQNTLSGSVYNKLIETEKRLTDLLALYIAQIDYPDDEIDSINISETKNILLNAKSELSTLAESYNKGSYLQNGINITIIGSPNAGKSSLFNQLCGHDRSIITDIKGTTRDVIEHTILLNGLKVILSDTAGIADEGDVIELMGIERSKKQIQKADIVLFVIDSTDRNQAEEEKIKKLLENKKYITLYNKADLSGNINKQDFYISAKTGYGIDRLYDEILSVLNIDTDISSPVITKLSQKTSLDQAIDALNNAINALDVITLDAVFSEVEIALYKIGEVSGKTVSEEVIKSIFENFCVGK